ncbi:MAG: NAD-dependent succinate-semialdehyde dehydrogenase [Gemmatimonadetes bacterium]|nr:NAD-dependent succinate-semialdehyde dehydrogenase [Gemmatimonadota bacterium]
MALITRNPATGEVLKEYPEHAAGEVERRLAAAEAAFGPWRREDVAVRVAPLRRLGALLRERAPEYGRLMTEEMGKPLAQAVAEAEKCARAADFYAEHAADFLAPEPRETDRGRSFVRFDPLGVILGIMPWNFPFWQVVRFAAPTLAAGNTVLLKHAPSVTGCSLALERLFNEAGFPEGAYQSLLIADADAAPVIQDERVRGVSFTGSDRGGSEVAALAGRAVKTLVLELGGSDPFVVFEDADLDAAVDGAVAGRTLNSGQSCVAAKRFIVHESRAADFADALAERMQALVTGDPTDPATDVGPLARPDLRDHLARQVDESVAKGARLLCGGEALDRPGSFYAPTVLADVTPGMPAADEETFGPVAAVLSFRDEADAVRLANATPYGLASSIWTGDPERAARVVPRIDAGAVFVNDFVKSDPRLPFGGVKRSGYGRELSREGIREFVNAKTVVIV